MLRQGLAFELEGVMAEGAMGEINTRARNKITLRADVDERVEGGAVREATLDELRNALWETSGRVSELFRTLDKNGDGNVSKAEFAKALPLIGFDGSDTSAIDALFEELDADGSGTIAYVELEKLLRAGLRVEISHELRTGAMGEIEIQAKNRTALRGDIDERKEEDLVVASVAELRLALWRGSGKLVDMFRRLEIEIR